VREEFRQARGENTAKLIVKFIREGIHTFNRLKADLYRKYSSIWSWNIH
jgi:hypothetical protein